MTAAPTEPTGSRLTDSQFTDSQFTNADGQLSQEPSAELAAENTADVEAALEELPENVPANAWVTMGLFAAFVIAFGTCASTFMFN